MIRKTALKAVHGKLMLLLEEVLAESIEYFLLSM
jgi:hypothetical protein